MMIHALWICFVLGLPSGELDDLPLLNGGIKRVSSYDLKEGNNDFYMVFPGQTLTLADIKGHGTIKRIYIKVDSDDPNHLRNMLLRFLWDNAEGASVDCPLGDFFALGHGRYYPVKSVAVVTGNRRGLTCYFPMPFFQRAQIFLEYEGRSSLNRIYYQIDYDPRMPPKEAGYFHAAYNQGVLNPGDAYYPVLHAEGKGKYVGLVLSMVLGEDGWFGEGDERIYVDDQNVPAVQGTGLDDLFGTAWGFEKGFNGPYSGTPVAGDLTRGSEFVGYRFHLRDPVTFSKSIDVVLEHLGERFIDDRKLGRDMSRRDEFYSVAYWYQVPPVVPFARMPVADYRVSGDRRFLLEGELLPIKPDLADRVKPELVGGATVARFTPKTVGDEAVFTLHTVQSGWYEVCGFFTRSSRHGIYQVRISDELLGDPVDFFKAEGGSGRYNEQRSDEIILGMIYLEGGLHEIGFEALEANEKAWGLLLDIDALIFRPVPQPKEDE